MARMKFLNNVTVVDLGEKGNAIGRTVDGEVVIVEAGAVPGDIVNLLVRRKRKGLLHGRIDSFVQRSMLREEPFCDHFEHCGGCQWQNLGYEHQIKFKEKKVRDAIKRIAHDDEEKVSDILKSEKVKGYRNKLEYTFSNNRWLTPEEIASGKSFLSREGLGFHIVGAFDKVLDIQSCHLQDELGDHIRNALRNIALEQKWSFYNIRSNHGFLRNLIIRNTSLGQWMITIIFGENRLEEIRFLFDTLIRSFPQISSWNYIINQKKNSSFNDLPVSNVFGRSYIEEKLDDLLFRIGPKSFFQTNSAQALVLYKEIERIADVKQTDIVYDLYTGTGSIALFLARHCYRVVGIEEVSEAVEDAKINTQLNRISNATFFAGSVRDILTKEFQTKHGQPNIVITDPPRSGMHPEVIQTILMLNPQKIVYVSCNPSTQARDILMLRDKYILKEVVPVDMFPQTSHVESVALLAYKNE